MRRKLYALLCGATCHSLFLLGVGSMAYGLFWGLSRSILPIGGEAGRLCNILLVLQFPLLHSLFLTQRGTHTLSRIHPAPIRRDLATTSFAILASLQLIATFVLWTPGAIAWTATSPLLWWILTALFIFAWILLQKAIIDADASVQSGLLGWWAVFRNKPPTYGPCPTTGLFRVCRQPIYLAFLLILLTGPVWTPDRLMLTLVWGAYCLIGPRFKEARFTRRYGDGFIRYQQHVPYFFPRLLGRSPDSAQAPSKT